MPGQVITHLCVPIRAVIAGSPILARRLTSIGAEQRTKDARLRELEETRLAAEWAKLPEEKRLAAEKEHRRGHWGKRVDAVISAGVVAVFAIAMFGGYLRWVLVALIVAWSVAAMMHAPPAAEVTVESKADTPETGTAEEPDDGDEWIQDSPPPDVLWALIRHTAGLTKQGTAAHLQAVLEEGQKRGQFGDWTVADLTEELASYGVPVVEGKKLTVEGRDRNRKAVLLTALPKADPAPFPAIVQPTPLTGTRGAA